jgi:hypothetical protein
LKARVAAKIRAAAAVRYPRVAANRQLPRKVHARRSVHHQVSPTCPSAPAVPDRFASPAHLSTSAPLSGPRHQARYPASYPATATWRSRHSVLVSCRLSPTGIASWTSCSRQRIPLSLRSAYRSAGRRIGPCRGFRVLHARDTTGLGAFSTPGRRCLPDQPGFSDRRLPLLSGQPCAPLKPPTCGAADNEAYEDSLAFTRPVFPLPVVPGWNRNASAFTLGFAPRGHPQRTPERGRPTRHWTESHPQQTTSNRT